MQNVEERILCSIVEKTKKKSFQNAFVRGFTIDFLGLNFYNDDVS